MIDLAVSCIDSCLRRNGRECIIGCAQRVLDNPPSIGSIITVKHLGYLQNGTLRHAFYWRERLDASSYSFPRKQLVSVAFSPLYNLILSEGQACKLEKSSQPKRIL